MAWKNNRTLYHESLDGEQTIPVKLTTREIKLIQNYLNKDESLNDPQNKECLDVVMRVLNDIVEGSDIDQLEVDVSNKLNELFGITVDIDPYGQNTGVELAENGLVEMSGCRNPDFNRNGKYADAIQGGFWDDASGKLTNGFISIEDLNNILDDYSDIDAKLQEDEKGIARIMLDI